MKQLTTLLISILFAMNLMAATQDKVTMPDTVKIKNTDLILNGMGTRKATWLKVKVYVGGLYLKKKSSDVNEVINMPGVKYLRMHFVRDVSAKKLVNAWNEGFEAAVESGKRAKIAKQLEKFNSFMEDVQKDDEIVLTFLKDGVEIDVKNKQKGKISGDLFAKSLLSIWFINPRDEGLAEGMLGK